MHYHPQVETKIQHNTDVVSSDKHRISFMSSLFSISHSMTKMAIRQFFNHLLNTCTLYL